MRLMVFLLKGVEWRRAEAKEVPRREERRELAKEDRRVRRDLPLLFRRRR